MSAPRVPREYPGGTVRPPACSEQPMMGGARRIIGEVFSAAAGKRRERTPTSAPGPGSPWPHPQHQDRAHPGDICTGTGLSRCYSCTGTALRAAASALRLGVQCGCGKWATSALPSMHACSLCPASRPPPPRTVHARVSDTLHARHELAALPWTSPW
jgi:hypothetical protein